MAAIKPQRKPLRGNDIPSDTNEDDTFAGMLLIIGTENEERGTGNGERGTGNRERESGNECTAVTRLRIQNGGQNELFKH